MVEYFHFEILNLNSLQQCLSLSFDKTGGYSEGKNGIFCPLSFAVIKEINSANISNATFF